MTEPGDNNSQMAAGLLYAENQRLKAENERLKEPQCQICDAYLVCPRADDYDHKPGSGAPHG